MTEYVQMMLQVNLDPAKFLFEWYPNKTPESSPGNPFPRRALVNEDVMRLLAKP